MSDSEFINETLDSTSDACRLRLENEKYRQELYETRRKLDISLALQKELEETNQSLEQSLAGHSKKLDQKVQEYEERYRVIKEEYESRLNSADIEIQQKSEEIDILQNRVTEMQNLISNAEKVQEQSMSVEDSIMPYKQEIEKLLVALQDEENKKNHLETTFNDLNKQYSELQNILEATKSQLVGKNEQLESIREELFVCRAELNTLKATPASDSSKGNSLFAEVEDRYQMIVGKMNMLQNKYQEAKRLCQSRDAENKALKAERAAMLKKWEHDTVDTMEESNELINQYKRKIEDLQNKLKLERKKSSQETKTSDSFSYLQSLLTAKKKEVEELQSKIENDAIKSLVQEDVKFQLSKQLRYWRYKAMSTQAQILALKSQLESGLNTDAQKMIEEVLKNCTINETNFNEESTFDYSIIMNEKKTTLEQLIETPKPPLLSFQQSSTSILDELEISNCYDQFVTLTMDLNKGQEPKRAKSMQTNQLGEASASIDDIENKENHQLNDTSLEIKMREVKPLTDINADDTSIDKNVKKAVRFTEDTKDTQGAVLRKQKKKENYPVVYICKKLNE